MEETGKETAADCRLKFRQWLECDQLDSDTRRELAEIAAEPAEIEGRFSGELAFGTGGMRGIIGAGLNRMNSYVVRRATQGLANYLNHRPAAAQPPQVAIAYDTRRFSRRFAEDAALVLAANGIKALLFDDVRPTPLLSFTIRELHCAAGIVITASHNPPEYNGYKVYGPDGGQAVSPLVDDLTGEICRVHIFDDVKLISRVEAEERGLLETIGSAIDRRYLERVRSLSLSSPQARIRVIYSPLHGTGACLIPALLSDCPYIDLHLVEEQAAADECFSTVDLPNPEEECAYTLALELARRSKAHLILTTDPDGDRVGCMALDRGGGYVRLTGNQVGALLLEYMLSSLQDRQALPDNGVIVKTIVTSDLGKEVASHYGVETVETLTGFKYIGEMIEKFEQSGERRFLFGYEESYGYLAGTFVRDKDAVIASYLLAEMAAYYQERGLTLPEVLEALYRRHGYFREELLSISLQNQAEADELMRRFGASPPQLPGMTAVEKRDYEQGKGWNLATGEEFKLTLPCSRVLYYRYGDGSWYCVRPSGTEPKIKIYFSTRGRSAAEAESRLQGLKEALEA